MNLETSFVNIELDQLRADAEMRKAEGWRYVQMLCTNTEDGIDLTYSYMKDGQLVNPTVRGVKKGQKVPSVSDLFFAAFVFENEAHDLFDVDITDIVIDFGGNFYALSEKAPMTIISPEKLAAREKAAKLAKAKAAKAAKEKAEKEKA
ncbi:MAG: NADH-quinone oxidoreductase subunit C, partial [Coriobacteriia bacterium]|nr:NADH-quinone oxidoreductase subunit C [Coriobacteriia bacterium]